MQPLWKSEQGCLNLVTLAAAALASSDRLNNVLQIGAFDGNTADPLFDHVIKKCRSAALVEPQPHAAQKLRERYSQTADKVTIVEAAISSDDGEAFMWSDKESSPKASLNPEHLSRFNLKPACRVLVKTMRPTTLLNELGFETPDLLQIDTEGMDWAILRLFLDAGIRPYVINYEHLHLNRKDMQVSRLKLVESGYSWHAWGWDTIAIRNILFD